VSGGTENRKAKIENGKAKTRRVGFKVLVGRNQRVGENQMHNGGAKVH
jgi:hypothetical protein